jgi:hypothetical protein
VSEIPSANISSRFGEQWLNQYQGGYADFDEEDRVAIREFALLWSIFEAQALLGDGRVEAIIEFVDDFAKAAQADRRRLLTAPFIPHLTYFRDQFLTPNHASTNELFEALSFQERPHQKMVSSALLRLRDDTPELVKALLLIVDRLRDSVFRGLKWHHGEKKQRDDLYHASKVLMKAVDISRPTHSKARAS